MFLFVFSFMPSVRIRPATRNTHLLQDMYTQRTIVMTSTDKFRSNLIYMSVRVMWATMKFRRKSGSFEKYYSADRLIEMKVQNMSVFSVDQKIDSKSLQQFPI
jgi:hypothetical protein